VNSDYFDQRPVSVPVCSAQCAVQCRQLTDTQSIRNGRLKWQVQVRGSYTGRCGRCGRCVVYTDRAAAIIKPWDYEAEDFVVCHCYR